MSRLQAVIQRTDCPKQSVDAIPKGTYFYVEEWNQAFLKVSEDDALLVYSSHSNDFECPVYTLEFFQDILVRKCDLISPAEFSIIMDEVEKTRDSTGFKFTTGKINEKSYDEMECGQPFWHAGAHSVCIKITQSVYYLWVNKDSYLMPSKDKQFPLLRLISMPRISITKE